MIESLGYPTSNFTFILEGDPPMQVGLSVGHLYVGSLGGITGVGGGPSLPLNGVREKDKVREAELGKTGFYIFSYSLFYLYCIFLFILYIPLCKFLFLGR